MRSAYFKKSLCLVLIAGLIAVASGCETMSAMKSGDVKMEDFIQMAKATLPDTVARPRTGKPGGFAAADLAGMDSWFQDNLW